MKLGAHRRASRRCSRATAAARAARSAGRPSRRSSPARWNDFVLEHATDPGHQRPLPRQHPARRHLLGDPAHPRRRDHAREADRRSARSRSASTSTARSPAASASTCSARASSSCPTSGRRWSTPGFESGHAYGKAMRTVKSCVGSTWCRYGVQDSTALAIRLEERYRGIRAPHKLKSAVSGCIRECAEAQSKDFGVIATEKGWNLYVCGNGGVEAAPRRPARGGRRRGDADPPHRPLPHVLHPDRQPARADGALARAARGRHRLPAQGHRRRRARHRRASSSATCRRWSTPTRASGRRSSRDPERRARVPPRSRTPTRPTTTLALRRGARPEAARRLARRRPRRRCLQRRSAPARSGCRVAVGRRGPARRRHHRAARRRAARRLPLRGARRVVRDAGIAARTAATPCSAAGSLGDQGGRPEGRVSACTRRRSLSTTGEGLSDPEVRIATFPARVEEGKVYVLLPPVGELAALEAAPGCGSCRG